MTSLTVILISLQSQEIVDDEMKQKFSEGRAKLIWYYLRFLAASIMNAHIAYNNFILALPNSSTIAYISRDYHTQFIYTERQLAKITTYYHFSFIIDILNLLTHSPSRLEEDVEIIRREKGCLRSMPTIRKWAAEIRASSRQRCARVPSRLIWYLIILWSLIIIISLAILSLVGRWAIGFWYNDVS